MQATLHALTVCTLQGDGNTTGVGATQRNANPPGYCYKSQPSWSAYRESRSSSLMSGKCNCYARGIFHPLVSATIIEPCCLLLQLWPRNAGHH